MGAAWHAIAAPGVGKPEVLGRNTKAEPVSPDTWGGPQPESRRQVPWEDSLLTSGKGLIGQCNPSAYLERGASDSVQSPPSPLAKPPQPQAPF